MKKNVEQDAQYAAELYADATREKLAEIYAAALLRACESTRESFADLWEEYDSFLVEACDAHPKFEAILASASVPVEEKYRIIDSLCATTTRVFRNFLKTLARRGRMDMLRAIRVACRRLDDERRGRVPVTITSAVPLDAATLAKLSARLTTLVGGEPKFTVVVDPKVIGGIVVRVGDVVYDASVATQLNTALQEIIDRSAHEIQSRRDSFRNSEGN